MPQWSAFVGLTVAVLVLLLVLARLSAAAVPASTDDELDSEPTPNTERTVPDERAAPTERTPTTEGPETATRADGSTNQPTPGELAEPTDRSHGDDEAPTLDEFGSGALMANVVLSHGLFGGIVAAAAWYMQIPAAALGWGTGVPIDGAFVGSYSVAGTDAVAVGLVAGVALYAANEIAARTADAAGIEYSEALRELLAPETSSGWLILLGGTLPIVAVVEELLFRAAAIGAVAVGFGVSPWLLAVISSVAFAFGHGAQGRAGIVVTGVLGFALAGLFLATWSLVVVVVAHYVVNALEFVVHEGLDIDR